LIHLLSGSGFIWQQGLTTIWKKVDVTHPIPLAHAWMENPSLSLDIWKKVDVMQSWAVWQGF
jgi:hypothetical protein